MSSPSPSDRFARFYGDTPPDNRTPAQRDRDRILYSSAFARLGGVTQVFSAEEGHVFHNRLTHSIEVAQFARRLTEKLQLEKEQRDIAYALGIDPDVVEAAALAHDLGHPPFGHIGEDELDEKVSAVLGVDGYEGNPQAFRIVTVLARRSDKPGLNLTRATLNAMLKYPWLRDRKGHKRKKWGAYRSETQILKWVRQDPKLMDERKSPEAEIMDWADSVTYAVHDAADFYRARLIPLDRLAFDDKERERFLTAVFDRWKVERKAVDYPEADLAKAFAFIRSFPLNETYQGTPDHRARLRRYTANLIGRYIHGAKVQMLRSAKGRYLAIDPEVEQEVIMWKELAWHYVILNPALSTQQYGQRRMIRTLFEIFHEAVTSKKRDLNILPFAYRDLIKEVLDDKKQTTRFIADFVASMTEHQVVTLHQKLTAVKLGSALDYLGT